MKKINNKIDVYSFRIIIYEVLLRKGLIYLEESVEVIPKYLFISLTLHVDIIIFFLFRNYSHMKNHSLENIPNTTTLHILYNVEIKML